MFRIGFYIRAYLWPYLKVRSRFWWWVMKYGGKKNIPPDVVFGAMRESMERMNINLKQALNHMSDDLSEEDKKEVTELLREAANLEDEANRLDTRHHIEQAAQDREQK